MSVSKSELARELMRAVFRRVGSGEIEKAKAYIAALSPENAAEIRAEARTNLGLPTG